MRGRIWLLALLLLPLGWLPARADIPPRPRPNPPAPVPIPAPAPSKEVNVVVELDPNAKEPRLIVPRSIVTKRGALDTADDTRLTDADSPSQRHIIIAGIALALAVACGGLWLVRKNRLNGTGLVLLLAMIAGMAGGAIALANPPPPPTPPKPVPPPAVNLVKLYDGKVKVETPAEGDAIKLIISPEMLAGMAKEGLKVNQPANPPPFPNNKPAVPEPK